ncbi:DUF4300 family protein [Peptostreptococcaceae bacterium AGR-M142]
MNKQFKISIALLTALLITLGIIRYNTTQFDFEYKILDGKNNNSMQISNILEQNTSNKTPNTYKKLVDNNILYLKNLNTKESTYKDFDSSNNTIIYKKTSISNYCKDINNTKYLNYFNTIFNTKTDKSNNSADKINEVFDKQIKICNNLTSCKQDIYTLLDNIIDTKSFDKNNIKDIDFIDENEKISEFNNYQKHLISNENKEGIKIKELQSNLRNDILNLKNLGIDTNPKNNDIYLALFSDIKLNKDKYINKQIEDRINNLNIKFKSDIIKLIRVYGNKENILKFYNVGISVNIDDTIYLIEKKNKLYPYQISKFKTKDDLYRYIKITNSYDFDSNIDRIKMALSIHNKKYKNIFILENNKLLNY